jgi:LacI family sucrose operon transcriptional repressor
MAEKKNITFNDIAKYTGFSKTTISRYFNNPDSLTVKNQQIIADALDRLNYKENKVARILASGQSEFIGVMLPDLFHHYYSEVLNQLLGTYQEFGYKFIVFNGNSNENVERKVIEELLAYKIEGLIILSHTIPSIELSKLSVPVVGIEREDRFIHSVNTNNYKGGEDAAEVLDSHHCEVLIHVNSNMDQSKEIPSHARATGFLDYCIKHGLVHKEYDRPFPHDYKGIEANISEILREIEHDFPDQQKGIFLSSDNYAGILINLLFRKYGRLPSDYRIIGFDNSSISRESVIPFSTIGQQTAVIAREAVSLLRDQMAEMHKRTPAPAQEPIHKIVEPGVYRRLSTEH